MPEHDKVTSGYMRALKYFTKPYREKRQKKDLKKIITKPLETTKDIKAEKLAGGLNINSYMSAIVSNVQQTRKKQNNRDEAADKYVMPPFKVEIKKKAALGKTNDLTAMKSVGNNTKLESTISNASSKAGWTLHTCSINECAKDCYIDERTTDKHVINENKSPTLTNTNTFSLKKNLIYRKL